MGRRKISINNYFLFDLVNIMDILDVWVWEVF